MEELFGISMNVLMYVLLGIFLATMAVVATMAFRNQVMLKLGLRNIPRRRGQTVLIVIGVMLSTVIMSAAFGTGDTLSYSIRNETISGLRHVDELIIPVRAGESASFGALYFSYERFESLATSLAEDDDIDGLTPQIGESVPVRNRRTDIGEGQMSVVGLDPALLDGFGDFELTAGGTARLQDLTAGEVFITEMAVDKLEARAGDELDVFLEGRTVTYIVRGAIKRGGLAGIDPTMVLPLSLAQDIFDQPGKINSIVVSNTGDERSGATRSEDVTKRLRVLFNDLVVAEELKELLAGDAIVEVLEAKLSDRDLGEDLKQDLTEFVVELAGDGVSDELNSLLSDQDLTGLVMDELDSAELREESRRAATLFLDLAEFRVMEIKRSFLEAADEVGSAVTSVFILFSSFSITVGILLIFLIFVMLAAARKSEMGMARAVGAKRRHLVLMFVFEGTAYAVVAAAVGVFLGLVVSAIMVLTLNQIFGNIEEAFRLTIHFEPRSVIVAYCLGMVITFATVAISAYRVSRLNIVVAIRGLPEAIIPPEAPRLTRRLLGLLKSLVLPLFYVGASLRSLLRRQFRKSLRNAALAVLVIFPVWFIAIILALLRLIQPYLVQGWLTLIAGVAVTYFAVESWGRLSYFGGGVSLTVLGLGLTLRWLLRRSAFRDDLVDRVAATAAGLITLAFWALPFSVFEDIVGDLEGDFDVMFVSGIAMVGAAVWVVMYNADLLLRATSFATGWIGTLRPVVVTAVAYPLAARFRTGLTLAMFALVIFTLMVMSVLTETFSTQFEEPRKVYWGYDIGGTVNLNTPIDDIRQEIAEFADLRVEDFEAIGGFTFVPVRVRAVDGENDRWHGTSGIMADDGLLASSRFEFKIIADGYGPTGRDVMQALRDDPGLAVIGGGMLSTEEPTEEEAKDRLFGGLYYGSEKMDPVRVEATEPRTGTAIPLTVVAVVDRLHRNSWSILASKRGVDEALPFPVPITRYRFRLADGVDAKSTAEGLQASLLDHGMDTDVFEEVLGEETAEGRAIFRLFTGFMALGLLVGVAALGVISTRAVVERRQQIGVLRAIGFKAGMIRNSMLMESSFVSLLGSIIGLALGMVLSYHAVTDIRQEEGVDSIRFAVPWLQVGLILGVTYVFSLLATFLPARQAAKIYPAEALRYE